MPKWQPDNHETRELLKAYLLLTICYENLDSILAHLRRIIELTGTVAFGSAVIHMEQGHGLSDRNGPHRGVHSWKTSLI
jgi:hypothetical protein